jgi:hypothetical protein
LEEAHRELEISPDEFDEVAAELARTLDFFKVPEQEKAEVLAAFAAHKSEVTEGYTAAAKTRAVTIPLHRVELVGMLRWIAIGSARRARTRRGCLR